MRRRSFLIGALAGASAPILPSVLDNAWADTKQHHIKQGGSMKVTYKNDPGTLDPAIGDNWENWPMMRALFCRPLGYKPGTTELTTEAAEHWSVSSDGKKYTIRLRPDLKYFDGTAITANDLKYSIDRVVDPDTASPGQSWYSSLVGYDAVTKGHAKGVAGIKVTSDRTIEFHLSAPDATFPQVLALNYSSIVNPGAVKKYGKSFGHHPVGGGAFYVESYNPGNSVIFKRNPHYFEKGVPYLDKIEFSVGIDPLTAFFQLIRGENDLLGDGVPGSQLQAAKTNPDYRKLLVVGHPLETSYITMNTQLSPFNDVRVRKAINMAIDKKRAVQVINGRGTPANQILPPNMPGYDRSYKGYEHDPDRARSLLKEAGFPNGFKTELYAINTAPEPKLAQEFQADLKKIGVDAELRLLSQGQVIAIAGTPRKAPMVWSGGLAWFDDFPDPSDFYGPILSCRSAVKGGWNWAFYCNKDVGALAHKANLMYKQNQKMQRLRLWTRIFDEIMNDAPWVPVYNQIRYIMHSTKISGKPKNVFVDPGSYINYSYLYDANIQ